MIFLRHSSFRMDPEIFEELLDICAPHLPIGSSRNGKSLSPRERMHLFLYYLSSNAYTRHMVGKMRTSYGAISGNSILCTRALFEPLVKRFINLPTESEARYESELFHAKSQTVFPKIVFGAIDGTHVDCIPPNASNGPYWNRKGRTSFNVCVLCGASSKVYYVSSCHPGCRHDTAVFKDSPLFRHLCDGWVPFEGGIILGDQGYPVRNRKYDTISK